MEREKRASQFAPFNALHGLQEVLRKKEFEHEKTQKKELSEEQQQKISDALLALVSGGKATVTYYNDGYYITESGLFREFPSQKLIQVNGKKIPFDDIVDIERINK